ncbi:hypothetical protein [Bacillus altitudinis]|uniref:hypothetical protein n=1 Tax=Bacillus altitudinis TaxID=293387 RepID=UPI0024092898|nr:hypothetical protein [Bacillus altitudinis]WEZ72387.1 hypothetical protein P5623_06250 [Bacillus altitudinis]
MSEVTLFHELSPKSMPTVFDCFITQKIRDCHYFMVFSEEEFNKRESSFLNSLSEDELSSCKEEGFLHFRDPFAKRFEQLRRYSFLVMIHSLLEEYVVELCRGVKDEEETRKQKRRVSKWEGFDWGNSGSTLDKVEKFFKNELKVQFPNQTKEWKIIKDVNLIRNQLVHNGGGIGRSRNYKRVNKIVKKMNDIGIGNHNTIVLDKDFCFNYLRTVEYFLSNLYKNYSSPPDN